MNTAPADLFQAMLASATSAPGEVDDEDDRSALINATIVFLLDGRVDCLSYSRLLATAAVAESSNNTLLAPFLSLFLKCSRECATKVYGAEKDYYSLSNFRVLTVKEQGRNVTQTTEEFHRFENCVLRCLKNVQLSAADRESLNKYLLESASSAWMDTVSSLLKVLSRASSALLHSPTVQVLLTNVLFKRLSLPFLAAPDQNGVLQLMNEPASNAQSMVKD